MTESSKSASVRVKLGERSYPVFIEEGILDQAGSILSSMGYGGKAAVVSQEAPARLFSSRLLESLEKAGFATALTVVPEGEDAKTLEQAAYLYDWFISRELDRWSPVLALGGGTTGDLAGFAAGTFMRGLPFFHVPTTLVAQVDSSIGGKVAVNLPAAKNIVGLFHQPRAVLADLGALNTLPDRDMQAGMAEIIRSAAIADARFFHFLEENHRRVLNRETEALRRAVVRAASIKARVVEKDETEISGERALLNYGHTIGHAIEAAAGFNFYRHGEAVSIGMAMAARLATHMGVASPEVEERQIKLLSAVGLPITLRGLSPQKVLNALKLDKKIKDGKIRFVLTPSIGHAKVFDGVDAADILRVMSIP